MKGQLTIEFLLSFGLTLILLSILITALIDQTKVAREKIAETDLISKISDEKMAAEIAFETNSKFQSSFIYRIENGRFIVFYNEKLIDLGGVFLDDKNEPV